MDRYIYFDHSATTPVLPEVVEEINSCFTRYYGNASEPHRQGREAAEIMDRSRQVMADCMGARSREIVFTSGGTESDNLAILGTAEAYSKKGDHIIISGIEHPAVYMAANRLARKGFRVTKIGVDSSGMVDPDDVIKAVTGKTVLVSIMHANNIVGTVQPIKEIGSLLKEKDVVFHTDAVQTFGSIPVDVQELGVDLLSVSGHKFYGPKGVGALYIRKGTRIVPQMLGGGHEHGIRSSTENIPGIAGMARAAALCRKDMGKKGERISGLREKIKDNILNNIEGVKYNGHPENRLPGNCNISFDYIEGEAMVLRLDRAGIAVSSGSACSSSSMKPSHVLVAMGLSPEEAHGSLRITLGFENTLEEVEYFLDVLPGIISDLRKISPLYKRG